MCIFRFSKKHHLVCFLSLLNYGDIGSVLINHLHIVIPLSYPCHYTNLCPHKPHKPAHTHTHTHTLSLSHTHTHTHTHVRFCEKWGHPIGVMVFILNKLYVLLPYTYPTPKLSPHRRLCISTFPKKTSLCMIYKRFEKWGHGSMS